MNRAQLKVALEQDRHAFSAGGMPNYTHSRERPHQDIYKDSMTEIWSFQDAQDISAVPVPTAQERVNSTSAKLSI